MIVRSLNCIYPPFRARLEHGLQLARQTGLQVYPFETYRSFDRQDELYAQGRTTPGQIVTRAKPGESWHNYGLAIDLVFDGSPAMGIQWSWDGDYVDDRKTDYAHLGKIMMGSGVDWLGAPGSSFVEQPHFEKTWGLSIKIAQTIYRYQGLMGVWLELDRLLKNDGG